MAQELLQRLRAFPDLGNSFHMSLRPAQKPTVSIIIRCCNEERPIGRLLTGIFAQSLRDFEVILVDSGSTDRTLAIACAYPVHVLSIRPADFSFGRALNIGCREARGDFLVFVSAHVYPVRSDWLEQLIAPFADPKVALTYGKQRGNAKTKYSEHQIFAKWFPEASQSVQKTPFCNNANAAIRRSLWKRLPYDEEITGLEDLDWARRILQRGYYLAYAADAEIIHEHDETLRRILRRYYREAMAFRRVFPEERFGLHHFLSLFVRNTISDYYHAARERVLMRHMIEIPLFRLMQFWGTYRGFARRHLLTDALRQRFYYPRGITPFVAKEAEQSSTSEHAIDYSHVTEPVEQ